VLDGKATSALAIRGARSGTPDERDCVRKENDASDSPIAKGTP